MLAWSGLHDRRSHRKQPPEESLSSSLHMLLRILLYNFLMIFQTSNHPQHPQYHHCDRKLSLLRSPVEEKARLVMFDQLREFPILLPRANGALVCLQLQLGTVAVLDDRDLRDLSNSVNFCAILSQDHHFPLFSSSSLREPLQSTFL